jgi:hypothetical protein
MGTARETTSMLSSLRTKRSERQEAAYPAPGSVSLLPLIKIHAGVVLDAETDGEFVYAALEFGSATNRALYLSTMRDVYGDVDTKRPVGRPRRSVPRAWASPSWPRTTTCRLLHTGDVGPRP